jgi:hypothetical protein
MQIQPPAPSISQRYAGTLLLLALMVAVDLLFILVHMLHAWSPWLDARHFALDADRGMAEQYQYMKLLWLCACLSMAFWQTRAWVYLGWLALFGFLLVDDATQFHERLSTPLSTYLGFAPAFGLRAKDFGEILIAALIGGIAVALVLLTFWRGTKQAKHISADLLCLLCVLAFFGVFFDALHTIAYFEMPALNVALTLIEDGGEMIVVSVITAYAFDVVSHFGELRIAIWSWLRHHPKG